MTLPNFIVILMLVLLALGLVEFLHLTLQLMAYLYNLGKDLYAGRYKRARSTESKTVSVCVGKGNKIINS